MKRRAIDLPALVLALVLAPVPAQVPAAPAPEAPAPEVQAVLEQRTPGRTRYVNEPFVLELRITIESGLLDSQLVQLFRRALDLPVHVDAPWLHEFEGATVLPNEDGAAAAIAPARRVSLALGDDLITAARLPGISRGGRSFAVFAIERRILPTRPGRLVFAAPELRFAYATRFEEGFLDDRLPLDRREVVVRGAPLEVEIRSLPIDGRPAGFSGAVGRFSVRAEVADPSVTAGESFRLTLRVGGEGNLASFDVPALTGLSGFHVYGNVDRMDAGERVITYDVVPLAPDITALPPIPLAFFDPAPPGAYRTVWTAAIPLSVAPGPAARAVAALPKGGAGVDDIFDVRAVAARSASPAAALPALVVLPALLGPWLLVWGCWWWTRARARRRGDPGMVRARAAQAEFRAAAQLPGADPADAFAEYLAARLGHHKAAVVAHDLHARLVAAGIATDLAARAAELLEELVAARYGGTAAQDARGRAATMVDALEARFAALAAAAGGTE